MSNRRKDQHSPNVAEAATNKEGSNRLAYMLRTVTEQQRQGVVRGKRIDGVSQDTFRRSYSHGKPKLISLKGSEEPRDANCNVQSKSMLGPVINKPYPRERTIRLTVECRKYSSRNVWTSRLDEARMVRLSATPRSSSAINGERAVLNRKGYGVP